MAAVGELEDEYGGRVVFDVVPAEGTALAGDELERFGFTALRHGLVVFDENGDAVAKLPGHQFGKDEIQAAIETALAGS